MFPVGAAAYGIGLVLLTLSVIHFAASEDGGLCRDGLYQLSRNPMYVAYFVFFLGCVLLTRSSLLLALLAVFQVSAHWIILAEERWCAQTFGEAYLRYKARVRRYI